VNTEIIGEADVDKWRKWLEMITVYEEVKARREVKYTRNDFVGTMQGHEFDLMLAGSVRMVALAK
jgi:hypothetical protein